MFLLDICKDEPILINKGSDIIQIKSKSLLLLEGYLNSYRIKEDRINDLIQGKM